MSSFKVIEQPKMSPVVKQEVSEAAKKLNLSPNITTNSTLADFITKVRDKLV